MLIGNTEFERKIQTIRKTGKTASHTFTLDTIAFRHCKDFLCPPEFQFKEWFPSMLKARIRIRAMDPFGLMSENWAKTQNNEISLIYKCKDENCHASIAIRKVIPDSAGNSYGFYGCFAHQHPLPRNKRSEIIFKNKEEAHEFYEKNLKTMYSITSSGPKKHSCYENSDHEYIGFECRRRRLAKGCGHHPCKSSFSIKPTFAKPRSKIARAEVEALSMDETPYSITGFFYHSHKYDARYHKDEQGLWKKVSNDPNKKPPKIERPRIRNGRVVPLSARLAGITKEDILKARVNRSPGFGKKQESRKAKSKRKKKCDKDL